VLGPPPQLAMIAKAESAAVNFVIRNICTLCNDRFALALLHFLNGFVVYLRNSKDRQSASSCLLTRADAPEFSWDRLHGSTQFVVPPPMFASAPRVAVYCRKHATSSALPPFVLLPVMLFPGSKVAKLRSKRKMP
jgi:hypothetical protein